MTKTVYLHVGPHKTGTTMIQKACLDNRDVLGEHGISYPSLYFSAIGHHELVNTVRRRAISDEHLDVLAEEHDKVVLSSENFIHFTAQDWSYLNERLSQFDVRVIYAWRRSSLKMYSMWQESIKHGGTIPFHAFYYKDLIRPGASRSLMQTLNIDAMAFVFGKERVHILDFDALSESQTLVSTFFDVLGIDGSIIDTSTQGQGFKNEALDPVTIEVLRFLNTLSEKAGHPKGAKTREVFLSMKASFADELEQVTQLMTGCVESWDVGDYFVDKATESAFKNRFLANIISYKPKNRTKNIQVINQDWLLNDRAYSLISNMHRQVIAHC
ncbi:hypothetical protein [Salinivibrio kushneri]|uniref:hypothetical protein n=1 Tax=Salinivibrio kushneri TaxID=1908198 RepID=UPI0022B34ED0|nr:hypothetical protein [Salinivibrio kushneri]WBA17117.1 hypothetical protein O4598_08150 [Salinivibrio kushneri]